MPYLKNRTDRHALLQFASIMEMVGRMSADLNVNYHVFNHTSPEKMKEHVNNVHEQLDQFLHAYQRDWAKEIPALEF